MSSVTRRSMTALVVLAVLLTGCASQQATTIGTTHPTTTTTSPAPAVVPASYQPLVETLGTRVADLSTRAAQGKLHSSPVAAAELLNANGNLGPALLTPRAIT